MDQGKKSFGSSLLGKAYSGVKAALPEKNISNEESNSADEESKPDSTEPISDVKKATPGKPTSTGGKIAAALQLIPGMPGGKSLAAAGGKLAEKAIPAGKSMLAKGASLAKTAGGKLKGKAFNAIDSVTPKYVPKTTTMLKMSKSRLGRKGLGMLAGHAIGKAKKRTGEVLGSTGSTLMRGLKTGRSAVQKATGKMPGKLSGKLKSKDSTSWWGTMKKRLSGTNLGRLVGKMSGGSDNDGDTPSRPSIGSRISKGLTGTKKYLGMGGTAAMAGARNFKEKALPIGKTMLGKSKNMLKAGGSKLKGKAFGAIDSVTPWYVPKASTMLKMSKSRLGRKGLAMAGKHALGKAKGKLTGKVASLSGKARATGAGLIAKGATMAKRARPKISSGISGMTSRIPSISSLMGTGLTGLAGKSKIPDNVKTMLGKAKTGASSMGRSVSSRLKSATFNMKDRLSGVQSLMGPGFGDKNTSPTGDSSSSIGSKLGILKKGSKDLLSKIIPSGEKTKSAMLKGTASLSEKARKFGSWATSKPGDSGESKTNNISSSNNMTSNNSKTTTINRFDTDTISKWRSGYVDDQHKPGHYSTFS